MTKIKGAELKEATEQRMFWQEALPEFTLIGWSYRSSATFLDPDNRYATVHLDGRVARILVGLRKGGV